MTCDLMLEWLEDQATKGYIEISKRAGTVCLTLVQGSATKQTRGATLAIAIQSAMVRENPTARTIANKLKSGEEPLL